MTEDQKREEAMEHTWNESMSDRKKWIELDAGTRDEWRRVFRIYDKHTSNKLTERLAREQLTVSWCIVAMFSFSLHLPPPAFLIPLCLAAWQIWKRYDYRD